MDPWIEITCKKNEYVQYNKKQKTSFIYIDKMQSPPYLHDIFHYSKDITGYVSGNIYIYRLFVPRVNNNFAKLM